MKNKYLFLFFAAFCFSDALAMKQEETREVNTEKLKDQIQRLPEPIRQKISSYLIDTRGFLELIKKGDLKRIRVLVELNPQLVHVVNDNNLTPLMAATINNHKNIVKYLVEQGAEDAMDFYGINARDIAQERGYLDIVNILDKE